MQSPVKLAHESPWLNGGWENPTFWVLYLIAKWGSHMCRRFPANMQRDYHTCEDGQAWPVSFIFPDLLLGSYDREQVPLWLVG